MTESVQIAAAGISLKCAKAAMIMLHGRGASAESMLTLVEVFAQPGIACLAPQAPGGSWYPLSFLAPIERNEPYLTQSLRTVGKLVDALSEQGFGPERLALLGFSQGGCLALEFVARNAQPYGAVIGLSAGLIGPEGTPRVYPGSLAGTRVFLGCSDIDAHIPLERVRETSRVLSMLGADVVERIYPGMGHTINDDEIREVRIALAGVLHRPGK